MDAAKAIWVLYENPDITVDGINPLEKLGPRKKARLICIPTMRHKILKVNVNSLYGIKNGGKED